jgi:hypothetical protein
MESKNTARKCCNAITRQLGKNRRRPHHIFGNEKAFIGKNPQEKSS